MAIFIGKACNCRCCFCPQTHDKPKLGSSKDTPEILYISNGIPYYYEYLLIKLKNAAASKKLDALGYSGGEPLLYTDRIQHYAEELNKLNSGLYQYVYTNGILATEDNLKKLRDSGIREIRFDLAATDFSYEAIERMGQVKKTIPFLTIEVPGIKGIGRQLEKNIDSFLDMIEA